MLAGVMVLVVARSVVYVPQGVAYVIERLGHFDRVIGPGLHVLPPFMYKVVDKMAIGVQKLEVPTLSLRTRDGVAVKLEGSARFEVSDPELAYEAMEFRTALVQLVASEWMRAVQEGHGADVDEALRAAEPRIRAAAADWGLNVMRASPVLTIGDQPPEPVEAPTATAAAPIPPRPTEVFPTLAPSDRMRFAVASGTIAPGALGLVEVDGTQRTARNLSATEIPRGFRCVVEGQEGETLLVRCL